MMQCVDFGLPTLSSKIIKESANKLLIVSQSQTSSIKYILNSKRKEKGLKKEYIPIHLLDA